MLTKIFQPILAHQENLYQPPKWLFRYREDNQMYENHDKQINYQILRQSMKFIQIMRNWTKIRLKKLPHYPYTKNFQAIQYKD